jgi:hypothetical protein
MLHYFLHIMNYFVKHLRLFVVCMKIDATSGSTRWPAFRKWFSVIEFLRICVWYCGLSSYCVSEYKFVSFHASRQGMVKLQSAGQKVFTMAAGPVVYNTGYGVSQLTENALQCSK